MRITKTRRLLTAIGSGGFFAAISALAQTWTLTSAPHNVWNAIASSADGSKLVVVSPVGYIFRSPDAGMTWTNSGAPSRNWYSVASSADGSRLESWIHVEIERISDPARIKALGDGLVAVLDDVRASVEDWALMQARIAETLADMGGAA